ncbi:MAG: polysaccharide biosynthesis C-terminal domain-containing protein [Lachnospiraceae bacterium]|nr:polysaccharide biosynthesis C-terminal domain-containing protein [Lachnospiraceae bacterium]
MSKIQLSDHFSISKLLKFTFPTMMMMVLYNAYVLIDGLFISNFVGSTAYAAVNLVGNYILIFPVIGTMLGSGGSALISKTLGEKKDELASEHFSMVIWVSIIGGLVLTAAGFFTVVPASKIQGATGEFLADCTVYGRIISLIVVFYIIQAEFQFFFAMVEKEKTGFILAAIGGVINISLDALFIVVFRWGLMGAAIASLLGCAFGGIVPILYFLIHKDLSVRLKKPSFDLKSMIKVCTNGSSEMVVQISVALVGILFNFQLMRYSGENGVASYGAIRAVALIFLAFYSGYAAGIIPVVGYHYGDKNKGELKSLLKNSLILLAGMGILLFAVSEVFAESFAGFFVGYDRGLCDMAVRGLRIYSTVFLFTAFNMFGSAFFTGLNDGFSSAVISLARTIVFLVSCVMLMPLFWGLDGIWASTTVSEILSLLVTAGVFKVNAKKYGFCKGKTSK